MGIFDEEERKMIEEAAESARREEQRKAELAQIAHKVSDDLIKYMVSHPRQHSVDVGVHENLVTLRKKTTSHMLEVTCTGREGFEVTIDGTKNPPTNRSGMARTVINWLKI